MKLLSLFLLLLIMSCQTQLPISNETFQDLDIREITEIITTSETPLSPQEIIKTYYPYTGNIQITEKKLTRKHTQVTLIHDNQKDDSVRGEKYVLLLKKKGKSWTAISLQKNWKCWRGHKDWSTEYCN